MIGLSLLLPLGLTTGYTTLSTGAQATERPFQPVTVPTHTPGPPPACLPLEAGRPDAEHRVEADLYYAERVLTVNQRVRWTNRTGDNMPVIVLNVEPNRWPNVFRLDAVQVDGIERGAMLDGKKLTIPLIQPVGVNCTLDITLDFTLTMPQVGVTVYSYKGFFGFTDRQINLGHWLPVVAPWQDDTWLTRRPALIGEQEVIAPADWAVTIRQVDTTPDVTIAGPGNGGLIEPGVWQYTYLNARDFSISISDQFIMESVDLPNGVRVEAYTFDDPSLDLARAHFLEVAADSLDLFAERFGAYTDDRLLVVQGDFPDGMEFSGLIFVGDGWFTTWDGTLTSYLTLITVHEVAHQWWYARVGNDPATDPWLDEALATYSEYIYIETYHPDLRDWWWAFRVDPFNPQGFIDSSVYEFESIRQYINAVYLRGVQFLHALRADLGDAAFFVLLDDYAVVGTGQIATPDLFWSLLTAEQLAATQDTRAQYMRQPDVGG